MFVARGMWCLADVSSVSPSSEQTLPYNFWKFEKNEDMLLVVRRN